MPVKIINRRKDAEPIPPRAHPGKHPAQEEIPRIVKEQHRVMVDKDSGEIPAYTIPLFNSAADPAKMLAEFDRLIKHFQTVQDKYPEGTPIYRRAIDALQRDKNEYKAFLKQLKK